MTAYIYDDDDNETEVELEGTVTKYCPARMYLSNGDPGYPEEGGELEDFAVMLNGKDITDTLSKDVIERLEEAFCLDWQESMED